MIVKGRKWQLKIKSKHEYYNWNYDKLKVKIKVLTVGAIRPPNTIITDINARLVK